MTQNSQTIAPVRDAFAKYVDFMVEYTAFLGRFCADEKDRLSAISSRELGRIQSSLATSQANAMQMANLEAKRIALQAEAGFDGMTFRQLVEAAPIEAQTGLWQLLSGFTSYVAEIRFFNDKSMAMARDNMMEMDPTAVLAVPGSTRADNPYEKLRGEQNEQQNSILEAKA